MTAGVRAGGLPVMTGSTGGARGPTEEETAGVPGGAAGMSCLWAVLLPFFLMWVAGGAPAVGVRRKAAAVRVGTFLALSFAGALAGSLYPPLHCYRGVDGSFVPVAVGASGGLLLSLGVTVASVGSPIELERGQGVAGADGSSGGTTAGWGAQLSSLEQS